MSMEQLQSLMNDISEWSDSTFGDAQRNPGIVYHLKMEADELIRLWTNQLYWVLICRFISEYGRQVKKQSEFAGLFMLYDSASHFHLSAEELIETTRKNLKSIKRKWENLIKTE